MKGACSLGTRSPRVRMHQDGVGEQFNLGAEQPLRSPLEGEDIEQVAVVSDMSDQSAGGGETQIHDPVPGRQRAQLGEMRSYRRLVRGREGRFRNGAGHASHGSCRHPRRGPS